MGVDIVYQQLNTATAGFVGSIPAAVRRRPALRTIANQSALMGQFRIHRNFYP